jgi:hypothetical protein
MDGVTHALPRALSMIPKLQRLLTALFLSTAFTTFVAAQDASQFDLSTDDGVNAARESITGKKIEERSKRCIRRDPSLPGIIVVGGFAFDLGCRLQGAFIGSSYVGTDDKSMSRKALEALGWKSADQKKREALAQAWVAKGLLGFLRVISVANEDFADRSFQAPLTMTKAGGETVVTLWLRLPSGRARGTAYQLREYRFAPDGEFAGNTTLENFTAPRN